MPPADTPREVSRQIEHAGRVLEFHTITWRDSQGGERRWESVERASGLEAVMTIPWLRPSGRLLLIRQFRPPARGSVLEFPAGIIDPGETPEAAAVRELKEEAGYRGRVERVMPPAFNTPGLSGETVYPVFLAIDETHPDNRTPVPEPDEGEHIEVLTVPRDRLAAFVEDELRAGNRFDSKVMAYILGLTQGDCR